MSAFVATLARLAGPYRATPTFSAVPARDGAPLDDRDHRDLPIVRRSAGAPSLRRHRIAAGVLLVCGLPMLVILLVQIVGGSP